MPRPFLPLLLVTSALWLGGDPLPPVATDGVTYPIVDTGQIHCYNAREEMADPAPGQSFSGQDAQYLGNQPQYRDQGDGTVLDLVTGLVWQQAPAERRLNQSEAEAYARELVLGGHDDWRLPTIKELFSIADFQGNMHTQTPYLDPKAFAFVYPEATGTQPGQRGMDAQYASSTHYLGITMGRDQSAFGFNFADGRIKSYPLQGQRYVRCVRGNPLYGQNRFRADADGTVTDLATGLVWQQGDSGKALDWPQALAYAESLKLAGHDDWRLPNVKELQSIVDYSRAPAATDPTRRGPAIDPVFSLTDPASWFWTGTTHIETAGAYYVAFGQAASARLDAAGQKLDAHGAGAVRSDPKTGDPGRWPNGLGPQADEVRILNYVRCVRGGTAVRRASDPPLTSAPPRPTLCPAARPRSGRQGQSQRIRWPRRDVRPARPQPRRLPRPRRSPHPAAPAITGFCATFLPLPEPITLSMPKLRRSSSLEQRRPVVNADGDGMGMPPVVACAPAMEMRRASAAEARQRRSRETSNRHQAQARLPVALRAPRPRPGASPQLELRVAP